MSPFEMEGNMVVENPFGKMPAPQYGSLPFFSFKVIYLEIYNRTGNNPYIFSLISIAVDCTTRTLTRILTLVVCMG